MYKIIYFLGVVVRQFFLPNPFSPIEGWGDLINIGASGLFVALSYAQVSMFYERGSNPAAGSFWFTIMYAVNTGVTYLIMLCYPITWLVISMSIIYLIGSFAFLSYVGNRRY